MEELTKPREKRIALFVPAWQEAEVITDMVNHNLANIEDKNYDFFIGVYPNDKPTVKKANRLVRKYPRVYKSEVPHPGPTNKADCLNWLYQRMKQVEETENKSYDIIIIYFCLPRFLYCTAAKQIRDTVKTYFVIDGQHEQHERHE